MTNFKERLNFVYKLYESRRISIIFYKFTNKWITTETKESLYGQRCRETGSAQNAAPLSPSFRLSQERDNRFIAANVIAANVLLADLGDFREGEEAKRFKVTGSVPIAEPPLPSFRLHPPKAGQFIAKTAGGIIAPRVLEETSNTNLKSPATCGGF